MCTTSFHPPLSECSKILNSVRASDLALIATSCTVIVANGCGYTQGLFWLPWRIILVGQENQIEATQNLPDVCFLDIRSLFCLYLCQRKYNAVSAIAGEIWRYRTGGNPMILTKIMTLLRGLIANSFRFLQPSIRLRYNY